MKEQHKKTKPPPPVMLGKHCTKAENSSTVASAKTSTNVRLTSGLNMAYRVEIWWRWTTGLS